MCRQASLLTVGCAARRLHLATFKRRCDEESSFGRIGQLDKIGDNLAIFDQSFPPRGLPDMSAAQPSDGTRAALKAELFEGHLPTDAATTAVLVHPRFPEAGRAAAAGLVAFYQGERVINQVMPDRIRYIISVFALHLHFAGRPNDPNSGLTASRLCRLCVERKICSEGRAEAMLAIMRTYGHLVPAPSESDRRLRRLVPAEPLFAWHRLRCTHFFAAAAMVMPKMREALGALDTPAFMPKFYATSPGSTLQDFTTSSRFRTSGCSSSATRAAQS